MSRCFLLPSRRLSLTANFFTGIAPIPSETPKCAATSSNSITRRGSGFSWMRNIEAMSEFSRCAATASLAASMNSSISRCAMLRGAVGEVDAGAAQAGLGVDGRARTHVVADVRDVDVERVVAVGQTIYPDGIVEIARGLPVDGHHRHVAEIAPPFEVGGRDRRRD